ncbi:MAG: aspartate 1-decarboxylase [Chthonomonas sp.]|nr:aspartate 1-decarboxylase [Chthonomonas sp.]
MRLSQILKAKLHHARVTYANPDYVGSIEVDRAVLDAAGIVDGELVHVWAVDHDARIITYVFGGVSGVVGLNGGAARFFQPGDRVIIAAFDLTDEPIEPKMLLLDEENRIVKHLEPFRTELQEKLPVY